MKLFITDKDNKYTDKFFDFVREKIIVLYYERVNKDKLIPFEEYINGLPKYKSLLKKYITANEICRVALYNIEVQKFGVSVTIKISEKTILPNTNIKVIELCKLINSGNLMLKAYPIFTEIFDEAKENIEKYYAEYALEES